jgi:NADH:ubiquinone oxidoreductase subunit E
MEHETLPAAEICACDWEKLEAYLDAQDHFEGLLIPILQKAQEIFGYLPKSVMKRIAARTGIPGAEIQGVATFYSLFRLTPVGENIIKVCHGTACHVSGADQISDAVADHLQIKENETTPDNRYTFTKVACLGCCSLAPVMMIGEETFGRLTPDKTRQILDRFGKQ